MKQEGLERFVEAQEGDYEDALAEKLAPGHEHYNLAYLIEALGLEGVNSHNALDTFRINHI